MNEIKFLADLLKWPVQEIEKAIALKNSYQFIPQKKKDGGIRKTYEPAEKLKELQKRLLKRFLYKITLNKKNKSFFKGFMPGISYVDNAKEHAKKKNVNYVLRLDLKNQFPSVKREHLRTVLRRIFLKEVDAYIIKQRRFKPYPRVLFPVKKVRWFRKMIIQRDPACFDIIERFVELLLDLTTYKNRIVQGAPTSPWLVNLFLSYSGLIEKVYGFLEEHEIVVKDDDFDFSDSRPLMTVYADDFTISSTNAIPRSLRDELALFIEQNSIFKVNSKKTLYSNRKRIAPLITGLCLSWRIMPDEQIEDVGAALLKECKNWKTCRDILYEIIDDKRRWLESEVRFPKRKIRKIRALIHQAQFDPEGLGSEVEGHIANLKAIYAKDRFPRQIQVPYKKYLEVRATAKKNKS